jgi:hypothetical protein
VQPQGAALTVDTRDFHRHLYQLAEVPPSVASSVSWAHSRNQMVAGDAGLQASTLWVRTSSERAPALLLLTLAPAFPGALAVNHAARAVASAGGHGARCRIRQATFGGALCAKLCSRCHACVLSRFFAVQVAFHAETGEAMGALAVVSELLNRYQKLRRLLVRQSGAFSLTPGSEHLPCRRTNPVPPAPTCRTSPSRRARVRCRRACGRCRCCSATRTPRSLRLRRTWPACLWRMPLLRLHTGQAV